ncbi:hypothetical protein J2Z66_002007 [Paenibacillus eucommiae]|uniref:Uncharacterized protein n=1 Tax=Paenibacillus eucommiae TaxID=1355755 RepID=A0ABS4IU60_9BACL|nr:hypothetical protein [Paenibacillus eucommiae]
MVLLGFISNGIRKKAQIILSPLSLYLRKVTSIGSPPSAEISVRHLTMFFIVKRSVSWPNGTLRMIFIVKRGRMAFLGGKRGF